MSKEPATVVEFNAHPDLLVSVPDLFMPNMVEVVKHLARMAAERDYNQFLEGQKRLGDPQTKTEDRYA